MTKYILKCDHDSEVVVFKKETGNYFDSLHYSIFPSIFNHLNQQELAYIKSTCKYFNAHIRTNDIVLQYTDQKDLIIKLVFYNKIDSLNDVLDTQNVDRILIHKALMYAICSHRYDIAKILIKYIDISKDYASKEKGCYIDNCAVCGHISCFISYIYNDYNDYDNMLYDLEDLSIEVLFKACLYSCNWKIIEFLKGFGCTQGLKSPFIFTKRDVNIIIYSPFLNSYDEHKCLSTIISEGNIKIGKKNILALFEGALHDHKESFGMLDFMFQRGYIRNGHILRKVIISLLVDLYNCDYNMNSIHRLILLLDKYSTSLTWLYRKTLTIPNNISNYRRGRCCCCPCLNNYKVLSIILDNTKKVSVKSKDLEMLDSHKGMYDIVYAKINNKIILDERRAQINV